MLEGGDQTFIYNAAGVQVATTNAAGATCLSNDSEGRLTSQKAPGDSQPTAYSFDPAGHVTSATNANGTVTYQYDEAGRLKDEVDASGAEASYAYDPNGT